MIIRLRPLVASMILLALIGIGGNYLVNFYIDQQLTWNEAAKVSPGEPGMVPTTAKETTTEVTKSQPDFYAEHRLEREKQRSQQVELLREIINNGKTSSEIRERAQQDWLYLTKLMEQELSVEKLVMSKGFADAILVFNQGTANVIVKTSAISQADALQVMELVSSTLGVEVEKVRVIQRT